MALNWEPSLISSSISHIFNKKTATISDDAHRAAHILNEVGVEYKKCNNIHRQNAKADLLMDYLEELFPELKNAKTHDEISALCTKYSIGIKVAIATMHNALRRARGNVDKARQNLFSTGKTPTTPTQPEAAPETAPVIGAVEQRFPELPYEQYSADFANGKVHVISDVHIGSPWFETSYYATIDKYFDEIIPSKTQFQY